MWSHDSPIEISRKKVIIIYGFCHSSYHYHNHLSNSEKQDHSPDFQLVSSFYYPPRKAAYPNKISCFRYHDPQDSFSIRLTAKLTKFCETWIKMLFGSNTPEMRCIYKDFNWYAVGSTFTPSPYLSSSIVISTCVDSAGTDACRTKAASTVSVTNERLVQAA